MIIWLNVKVEIFPFLSLLFPKLTVYCLSWLCSSGNDLLRMLGAFFFSSYRGAESNSGTNAEAIFFLSIL